jgi:hypothetical protein
MVHLAVVIRVKVAEDCREVSMSKEIGSIESIEAVLRQPIL